MAEGHAPDRGILAIDKESGPTSHDVVARVRRLLGVKKVGHCGTLDPLATGLLVVCFGRYTRLADWISAGDKEYEATFQLGADSDTGDAEGPVREREVHAVPSTEQVEEALAAYRGPIDQVPPAHSAVKVGGVPSYKLARRDRAVALVARRVQIHRFDLARFEYPSLDVRVVCSKGTYIRSLARDVGEHLGCGAYVRQLRRCRIGEAHLEGAHRLEALGERLAAGEALVGLLTSPGQVLGHLGVERLTAESARLFAHGGQVEGQDGEPQAPCAVVASDGELLGIARRLDDGRALTPLCVVGDANGN